MATRISEATTHPIPAPARRILEFLKKQKQDVFFTNAEIITALDLSPHHAQMLARYVEMRGVQDYTMMLPNRRRIWGHPVAMVAVRKIRGEKG